MNTRRSLLLVILLVLCCAPVVFEPVDQKLEWHVVGVMEVKTFGPNLDELFENLLFRNVANDDMLRVDWQNGKSVRNSTWFFLLFLFQSRLEVFKCFGIRKLLVTNNISHEPIAWNDVALDDFSKTLKVVVVADDQRAANSCTWLLISLNDIDVHVMILPEFPSESDALLTSSRWPEKEITCL